MGDWSDLEIWLSGIGGRGEEKEEEEDKRGGEGICKKSNNPTLKGGEKHNSLTGPLSRRPRWQRKPAPIITNQLRGREGGGTI